jgi:tetratricopeptide (TPR) repeat protein
MGNIIIEVEAGDGTIPTEAEIRTVLASTTTTGELTPEEKKRQADLAKKSAEIQAKNERNKNANQIFNRAIGEGKKAYDAKDWDTAIAKFDEGYNADPEFAGSAPIFLNNKADALKQRAIASYQKSTTDAANKATLIEAMKKDLLDSIAASQKALDVLKNATSTEANVQKSYDNNRIVAYAIMSDSYRILIESRADESKIKEAVLAVDGYSGIESDAPKKTKAQIQMADAFRKIGKSDEAIPLYRKVLETSPDDSNALGGLGLSLFNSGAIAKAYGDSERNEAKKQEGIKLMQEGLDYMQRFVDTSPVKPDDTQQMKELKVSVKEAVDYIKTQEKLTPQKTNRPATNTKKRG